MLTLVIGAGASYDSVYHRDLPLGPPAQAVGRRLNHVPPSSWDHPLRPPLAKGLIQVRAEFGTAIDRYPAVRALLARLRRIFETKDANFEVELDQIIDEAEKTAPHLLRELAAFRFYIRDVIAETTRSWSHLAHGVTNYHALLERIETWRRPRKEPVVVVTFNYDTLIEQAMSDVLGLVITDLRDYMGPDDWKWPLFKLHGSTSWGRAVRPHEHVPPQGSVEQNLIRYAAEVEPTTDFYHVGESRAPAQDQRVLLPAIAIPTTVKADFECPTDHIDRLKAMLPEVDRVLVIGWRAAEKHFMNLWRGLAPNNLNGFVVNGDGQEAGETAQRLMGGAALPAGSMSATQLGFSTLVSRQPESDGESIIRELLR